MVVKPDNLTRDKTRVESHATRVDPKLLLCGEDQWIQANFHPPPEIGTRYKNKNKDCGLRASKMVLELTTRPKNVADPKSTRFF